MTKNEYDRESKYFQSGHDAGSNGWRCDPAYNGKLLQSGSYACTEYIRGHEIGSAER